MKREFLAVYWRDMIRFVRFRAMLFSSLIQPVIWMAFFGLAMSSNFDQMSSMMPSPPGSIRVDYLTFMAAGVIAMTTLFTSLFGGITLIFDKNWGLMKEMMAAPMSRMNILFGISLSGVTKALLQSFIVMGFGIVLGISFFSGFGALEILFSIVGIVAFIALFSLGFLFLSASITMRLESMEGVQGVMTLLTMPIFFSSNALYSTSAFPEWLKVISVYNPLTYLVKGLRYFTLGGDFYAMGTHYTYSYGDVMFSFGFLALFTGVTYVMAWQTFRKAVVT